MITYEITPFISSSNSKKLHQTSVYDRLFKSISVSTKLPNQDGESEVEIDDGFSLHVKRKTTHDLHPIDALAFSLMSVRGNLHEGRMIVPGQGFHNSYTAEGDGPTEGIAFVLCRTEDWSLPREESELGFDPMPALHDLLDNAPVENFFSVTGGRSLVTADARGLIVDYVQLFDHAKFSNDFESVELDCDEESSPILLELAVQHAMRSFDVRTAALNIDILGNMLESPENRKNALVALRSSQLRMTARSIEALVENRKWHTFIAHDSFRVRAVIRRLSATADRSISEQFNSIHPIIEAAEADIRGLREQDEALRVQIQAKRDLDSERRNTKLIQHGSAIVGGAALVGVFASLAGIGGSSPFSPYLRAAFATIVIAIGIGSTAWLLDGFIQRKPARSKLVKTLLKLGGGVLIGVSFLTSLLVWSNVWTASPSLLGLIVVVGLAGGSLVLYVREPELRADELI